VATNFKIFRHQTRDSLHLKLDGDFDGNSAHELINTIIEYGRGYYQIFIDTNDLKNVYPFGRDVFQKNLGKFNKKFGSLVFVGENERNIVQ